MTSQKIKDGLTTSYMLFVFDFGDPAAVDREAVEKTMGISLGSVFDTRPGCHRAIQRLGKTKFKQMMALYFMDMKGRDGLDDVKLAFRLEKGKDQMRRHLGADKLALLNLLLNISKALRPEKRGLLFEEAV